MNTYTFAVGNLADGPVSAAASVRAENLEAAKARLTRVYDELEVEGSPSVIDLHHRSGCSITVRIAPEAIRDDANWEQDE